MLIRAIRYPIYALGPGKRIGIWTSGCKHECPQCISKHYWDFDKKYERSVIDIIEELKDIISNNHVDGISISGGDPFYQIDLLPLLKEIAALGIKDVLVYTGFLFESLQKEIVNFSEYISHIGVLIDGPYIEELNDGVSLRGSSNQRIIVFKKELQKSYVEYINKTRDYDFFMDEGKMTIIGIPPKGFYDIINNN